MPFLVLVPVHPQSDRLQGLDTYVERALAEWRVPGVAIAVVKDDAVVLAKGYGVREHLKPARVDQGTLFAIGSCSKAFAAATVAMLVDEGKLGWEDRVQGYLPWLEFYDPWVTHEIRVRELLAHRLGTSYLIENRLRPVAANARDLLQRARSVQPVAPFRERYVYSNNAFIAAGQLVSAVSGRKWEDFARDRLWLPLGMRSTNASVPAVNDSANRAVPHVIVNDQVVPIRWEYPDAVAVPSGGVNSTALDMAQWLRFQLGEGRHDGRQLISSGAFQKMHQPQTIALTPTEDPPIARLAKMEGLEARFWAYGLGWFVTEFHNRKLLWHSGSITGFRSVVGLLPEERLGVAVLINQEPADLMYALLFRILDTYLGGPDTDWNAKFLATAKVQWREQQDEQRRLDQARRRGTTPSLPLDKYVGTYADPAFGEAQIALEAGTLSLRIGGLRGQLEHWHHDVFRTAMIWGSQPYTRSFVTFSVNEHGEIGAMDVQEMSRFTRMAPREGGAVR
ncbi:MAG: serine hydrolase [Spirochaetes bacterium]|nr:serine hydrolase [Spirochaetota bacterium]